MTHKICTKCNELKLFAEFYNYKRNKNGLTAACKKCSDAISKNWISNNPEKYKEAAKNCYQKHLEKVKEYHREYRKKEENRIAKNLTRKIWRESNREKDIASTVKWQKNNPEKQNAINKMRKARKIQAIPRWINKFFVDEIYKLSLMRYEITGIKHHVDHIVPLQSKLVCGLHVEHNLQIIPASVNQRKSNVYWPDMPG